MRQKKTLYQYEYKDTLCFEIVLNDDRSALEERRVWLLMFGLVNVQSHYFAQSDMWIAKLIDCSGAYEIRSLRSDVISGCIYC